MLLAVPRPTEGEAWVVLVAGLVFLGWSVFAWRNGWNSTPACIGFGIFGLAAVISGIVLAL